MIEARRAGPDDAAEIIRLRAVMLAAVDGLEPALGPWLEHAEETLRSRLPEPEDLLAAFVIDRPDQPHLLAACAVGVIESRLGTPANPSGTFGYVFNVATDAPYRRQGYSRACMQGLLAWFDRRGVTRIDLRATPDAEPLYASLGFVPAHGQTMLLTTGQDRFRTA